MHIGTPLSPSATHVMLLGAGELGKEVIIALQRLGVEVTAVDRYEGAPGHQVAHHTQCIDMTNGNVLSRLIDSEKPQLVVPEIEAIATDTLVQLEKEGLCRVIPTARAANLTMNREGIRRLAAETLKLPTSPYAFADSFEALKTAVDGGIGYPCVIKPVMSSSGKGQSKVDGPDELKAAWDYAFAAGRVKKSRVIVEGFIDFDYEITLLTVRALGPDGKPETHFCEPVGHVQVKGDYVESWQPQAMSQSALESARAIAKAVTSLRASSSSSTLEATSAASSQSSRQQSVVPKIACAGCQCTAITCKASTPASASHSLPLLKKLALKALPCSARALKALKNWNSTKVVKASVSA
jgi:phosphoribosylglycinamide formyltransferase 2